MVILERDVGTGMIGEVVAEEEVQGAPACVV